MKKFRFMDMKHCTTEYQKFSLNTDSICLHTTECMYVCLKMNEDFVTYQYRIFFWPVIMTGKAEGFMLLALSGNSEDIPYTIRLLVYTGIQYQHLYRFKTLMINVEGLTIGTQHVRWGAVEWNGIMS